MKQKTKLLITLCIFFAMISCSSHSSKKKSTEEVLNLKKGEMLPKVICANAKNCSYTLYLPEKWDSVTPSPVMFLFDAHARSIKICKLFKKLADTYSIVLAASNESKNGLSFEETDGMYQNIYNDLISRIKLDVKRIYTAGFSGGGKIAGMLIQKHQEISAVISMSSIAPPQAYEANAKVLAISIAGTKDFNFTDIYLAHKELQNKGLRNQFIDFNGKHEYPTQSALEEAMLLIQAEEIKKKLIPSGKNEIEKLVNAYHALLPKNKELAEFDGVSQYKRMLYALEGLTDLSSENKEILRLGKTPTILTTGNSFNSCIENEAKLKDELANNFTTKDSIWWKTKVKQLNAEEKGSEGKQKSLQAQRLKAFVSMLCYMQVQANLNQKNLEKASEFLNIYRKVDPENPDVYYFNAILAKTLDAKANVIPTLLEAVKFGYYEDDKLANEPLFDDFKQSKEFTDILDSARKNFVN